MGAAGGHRDQWRHGLCYAGNNGTTRMAAAASVEDRQVLGGTGAFRKGDVAGQAYTEFTQSYDPLNSYSQGSSSGAYVVQRSGETLRSVAQMLWGDASLWYKLAEANGLSADMGLAEGQRLTLPQGVNRTHNNASTLKPYDANDVIGNVSPSTAKPPKKNKCGAFGQILLVVIAIAVAVALKAPVTSLFSTSSVTATTTAIGASMVTLPAIATVPTLSTLGAIAAGATVGVASTVVSQGVGIATGIQDKFSWSAVALAGIGGAVGGALNGMQAFGTKGLGKFTNLANDVVSGGAANAAIQGIGVATGLQDRFSWAGFAGSAVGSGAGGASSIANRST